MAEAGNRPVVYLTAFTSLDETHITRLPVVRKCRRVFLGVKRSRKWALRFYRALGLHLSAIGTNVYRDPC